MLKMSVIFCITPIMINFLLWKGLEWSNEKWIYYVAAYPNPYIVAEL